ncbi:MAG: carbohydrate kinase [Rhizobiaceae bacterium]|nr:carbohydrate kinase [Rhizobiaceae bacterium]
MPRHRVIAVGSVNHDRIWHLNETLTPGGRLHFTSRTTQLGGGAYYTGCQLLELGAHVALISRLMADERGIAARNTLATMGFDCGYINMLPGQTTPLEILLEPSGERTILARSAATQMPLATAGTLVGEAVYINAVLLEKSLVEKIEALPLVMSQMPLRPAIARASDVVISSRADVPGDNQDVWNRAAQIAGSRLKMLVLTDGPRAITLFDGRTATTVEPQEFVRTGDTIGAGDRFAGSYLFALLNGHDHVTAARQASALTARWLREPRQADTPSELEYPSSRIDEK